MDQQLHNNQPALLGDDLSEGIPIAMQPGSQMPGNFTNNTTVPSNDLGPVTPEEWNLLKNISKAAKKLKEDNPDNFDPKQFLYDKLKERAGHTRAKLILNSLRKTKTVSSQDISQSTSNAPMPSNFHATSDLQSYTTQPSSLQQHQHNQQQQLPIPMTGNSSVMQGTLLQQQQQPGSVGSQPPYLLLQGLSNVERTQLPVAYSHSPGMPMQMPANPATLIPNSPIPVPVQTQSRGVPHQSRDGSGSGHPRSQSRPPKATAERPSSGSAAGNRPPPAPRHSTQMQQQQRDQMLQQQLQQQQQQPQPQQQQQQQQPGGSSIPAGGGAETEAPLEKISIDDFHIETRREGSGREVRVMADPVLPAEVLQREEQLARPALQSSSNASASTTGNGSGTGPTLPAIYPQSGASSQQQLRPASWKTDNVINDVKAKELVQRVLQTQGLKIRDTCIEQLSTGIQMHLKAMIESAMMFSRRRRNRNAIQSYENIQSIIRGSKGLEAPQELRLNIGMKWGPDVDSSLREEILARNAQVKRALAQDEADLLKAMRDLDESMKGKKGGAAEGEELWWEKELTAELNWQLGWSELAVVHLKQQLADKHTLGPRVMGRSKRAKPNPAEERPPAGVAENDATGTDAGTANGDSDKAAMGDALAVNKTMPPPSVASAPSSETYVPTVCPLGASTVDEVTIEDLKSAMAKVVRPRAGGVFGDALGRSLLRSRLHLPPKK